MNRKKQAVGICVSLFIVIGMARPFTVQAEGAKDSERIIKLEDRMRDLEGRMAKVEATSMQQANKMMQHDHGMMGKGMGANNPMGQMPQQVPPQNPGMGGGMPQGGAPQQQGGNMPPSGGMGDM